jgi:hypothetical protein
VGEHGAPAVLVEVGERNVAAQDEVERPVRRRLAHVVADDRHARRDLGAHRMLAAG